MMSNADNTPTQDDDDTYPPAYRELVEPSHATPKAIRSWALSKGLPVGKRGRIADDVVMAYEQAKLP